MNENELKQMKKEVEADFKSATAAIDLLIGYCGKIRETKAKIAPLVEASRPRKPLSQTVEEIIRRCGGDFDIPDIYFKYEKETGKKGNENVRRSISQVINKLRHREPAEIIEVKKGEGSRSGVYRVEK